MAVNTAQIKSLLEPGLWKVAGMYDAYPQMWSQLGFKVRKSTLATERKAQMRFLGLAQIKTEGGATAFDNSAGQRFIFNATTFEVGLGYAITRKSIDDNQYTSDFNQNNLGLTRSFAQFKDIQAHNIFNNGTTYDANVGGDGVALFSTAHPYDGGTWSNRFTTDLDLNESSLTQALLNIQQNFVDETGLKVNAFGEKLLVPIQLIPTAERITKSELRPGTANNDINVIRTMPGGITGYVASRYFTSSTYWFIRTNMEGLDMWERVKFETSMWTDDVTDNLLVKAYERYTPAYSDPRSVYGSFASS